MSSWYDAWADRYAEWSTGLPADVPFYVELARETNGLLVELAVGNGRVAIPVAQATGRRVVGIDSSPAMLEQARVRAQLKKLVAPYWPWFDGSGRWDPS
jgi:ubiquinone/menaquinone biosynthesis C-methylase UbiE